MNKIAITLLSVFIGTISFTTASTVNFSFTKDVYVVTEGLRAVVTVKPNDTVESTTILTIEVKGKTAKAGTDFVLPGLNGVFQIPYLKGERGEKNFSVLIKSDTLPDTGETIEASIKSINGVAPSSPITTTISTRDIVQSTTGSSVNVSIDKTTSAYNEMFMVTVTGLPANYFTTGEILRFPRQSAPDRSSPQCLSGSRVGTDFCQLGEEISCGILPKYMGVSPSQWNADGRGKLEFVCYVNDSSNLRGYPKISQATQVYTVKVVAPSPIPYTNGGVTPPITAANSPTVSITAKGTAPTEKTNYNNCVEGKGIDPYRIYAGCSECKYLPEGFRSNFSTCQNMRQEIYTWSTHKRGSIFEKYSSCGSPRSGSCDKGSRPCEISTGPNDPNGDMYICTSDFAGEVSGKVVDTNGNALSGVKVTAPNIGYGSGSAVGTTDVNGKYVLATMITTLTPFLNFQKTGYASDGVLAVSGENETFILRAVGVSGQLELCPVNVMRYVPGTHKPCNCPSGTTKEVIGSGFKCATAPISSVLLNMNPSVGTFDPSKTETLVFNLSDAQSGDLQACYAVLANPSSPTSVNATYCDNVNNFVDFNGNDDWKFEGNKLVGRFTYNASTWGNGGVITRSYFRKKSFSSDIVTATIKVIKPFAVVSIPTTGNINNTIDGSTITSQGGESGLFNFQNVNPINFDLPGLPDFLKWPSFPKVSEIWNNLF